MGVEPFLKLKEYDSLTREKNNHLKAQKDQVDRLSSLNIKRQDAISDTDHLKKEIHMTQQTLFEVEQSLKTAELQAQRLKDIGGDDHKIQGFLHDAQKLEEQAFSLLDKSETLNSELSDRRTFLVGLEKTIAEISLESQEEQNRLSSAIKILDQRLNSLFSELPDNFKTILQKTLAKNLAVGSFTRIEGGSCYFCRAKISRVEESEIDMLKQLKVCHQCSRIFLPLGS